MTIDEQCLVDTLNPFVLCAIDLRLSPSCTAKENLNGIAPWLFESRLHLQT